MRDDTGRKNALGTTFQASGAIYIYPRIVGGVATPTAWKIFSAYARALGSDTKAFSVFLDGYLLQGLQILLEFRPLKAVAGLRPPTVDTGWSFEGAGV